MSVKEDYVIFVEGVVEGWENEKAKEVDVDMNGSYTNFTFISY